MRQIRTDLAMEAREFYCEQNKNREPEGVQMRTEERDGVLVTRVRIVNHRGEQLLGKPVGNYVTLECPELTTGNPDDAERISRILSHELGRLLPEHCQSVFVAGLGNWNITPDALGPKTASKLFVTRHLKEFLPERRDAKEVCAISPGVLGLTGIETGEIIKGIAASLKPDCVIAIDALASRKMSRVNTTIQLSDTGISPGAGVGNHRFALTKESIGVPVIGIGVPTVVDAATIAGDAVELLLQALHSQSQKKEELQKLSVLLENPYDALREVLHKENLIVAPKDADFALSAVSNILASGLNLTFHPDFTYQELLQLQN
ncbi:MAG: GPR endopeptidase [Ruminococcaceae bacterium]|nr:GPR endopeptidase [Oscillospiraceae bacterium]